PPPASCPRPPTAGSRRQTRTTQRRPAARQVETGGDPSQTRKGGQVIRTGKCLSACVCVSRAGRCENREWRMAKRSQHGSSHTSILHPLLSTPNQVGSRRTTGCSAG